MVKKLLELTKYTHFAVNVYVMNAVKPQKTGYAAVKRSISGCVSIQIGTDRGEAYSPIRVCRLSR